VSSRSSGAANARPPALRREGLPHDDRAIAVDEPALHRIRSPNARRAVSPLCLGAAPALAAQSVTAACEADHAEEAGAPASRPPTAPPSTRQRQPHPRAFPIDTCARPPRLRPSEVCQRRPHPPATTVPQPARIEKPSGKRPFAAPPRLCEPSPESSHSAPSGQRIGRRRAAVNQGRPLGSSLVQDNLTHRSQPV
jgi:hypothetical protein